MHVLRGDVHLDSLADFNCQRYVQRVIEHIWPSQLSPVNQKLGVEGTHPGWFTHRADIDQSLFGHLEQATQGFVGQSKTQVAAPRRNFSLAEFH